MSRKFTHVLPFQNIPMSRSDPDINLKTHIPTPTEVSISKAIIEEYKRKEAELQVEVDELRKRVDQLEAQRKGYRRKIRKERRFISLARHLPPEVLAFIFSFGVDKEFSYKLAIPMRVCKAWYHAVVSCCARLWSYVRLDGQTRHEWWNGAMGSPTVLMPSTAPVMGYLRACINYSGEVPLTIFINLGDLAQSLGAGPYDPNSVNLMRCLRTLIGENGKHLPRWRSLSLYAGARVGLDEDLLQVFYQDIPNLVFVHLQNFSDLAFPVFKSLPSLLQYSRGGHSGSHDVDSIPRGDRGNVKSLQTFITFQEWTPKDHWFCEAFQNITSLSIINPRSSKVMCGSVTRLSLPHLVRLYLEGPFTHVLLSEFHLPKLLSFIICANDEKVDPLEDVFQANMELPHCSYVVWRNSRGNLGDWKLRECISRLFEYFKALKRLDLEPWMELIVPPEDIGKIMQENSAWDTREPPLLITYREEMMYLLSPPDFL